MGDNYTGNVSSLQYNGEATLIIDEKGLTVSSMFSDFAAGYEEITAIRAGDYTVDIITENDTICCSRLGNSNDWFYNNLNKALNSAVTKALKVSGGCIFETKGSMAYEGLHAKGTIRIFEDCICLLPPGVKGRRLPFAFMNGLKKEDYSLRIQLITGESAELSMVGRDLDPLEKCIVERVRALREKSGALASELCAELSEGDKARAANILVEKLAVPISRMAALPQLGDAVKGRIAASEMKNTWQILEKTCDMQRAAVGIWRLSDEEVQKLKEKMLEKLQGADGEAAELTPEQEEALKWMIWAAVPSADGKTAVVEAAFPDEEVATYVYRIPETWETFLPVLNRAMEAADFDRELILISDDKLRAGADPDKKMLINRTPAIEVLRKCFAGRIIHRSLDSWEKGLRGYLEG